MRTAILLLAAGGSTRMRGADKLMEPIDGIPLLTRSAHTALASRAVETVAVLGANRFEREGALDGLPIRIVVAGTWQDGMGASLAAGVAAVPDDIDAVIVMLADMPDIGADLLDRMILSAAPGAIVRPVTVGGKPGNPVLFGRIHLPALGALTGDGGARTVIAAHPGCLVTIPATDSILVDLDTPEAWATWHRENRG